MRDEAEDAIDAQGRVRGSLAGSDAGDEIGDLSRSFSSVLARLAQYAGYRENWRAASRTSCVRRSPSSARRSTTSGPQDETALPGEARVYIERAQGGLQRLAHILTRMTEATRLEQSLHDVERERVDLSGSCPAASTATGSRTRRAFVARRSRGGDRDRRCART